MTTETITKQVPGANETTRANGAAAASSGGAANGAANEAASGAIAAAAAGRAPARARQGVAARPRRSWPIAGLAAVVALAWAGAPVDADAGAKPKQGPALSPGLAPLAPMLGTWDTTETFHAGGFVPKTATARGTDVLRVGPGGNAIIADYRSTGDLGPYAAHDMITWDPADQRFHFLFIDSFGPSVQLHRGRAVGASFVFEGPFTLAGVAGTMRRTYKDLTATSGTLVVDFVDGGGAVTKLVTIEKRRRK